MSTFTPVIVMPQDLPHEAREIRRRWREARVALKRLIDDLSDSPYKRQLLDRYAQLMAEYEPVNQRFEEGLVLQPSDEEQAAWNHEYWDELERALDEARRYQGN